MPWRSIQNSGPLSLGPEASARCGGVRLAGASGVGARVIYYARTRQGQIWLLTIYGKSVKDNIPAHVLRQIREEIDD